MIKNLVGEVVETHVGGRSKSGRRAVVLRSKRGDLVLRIPGGNPYDDPALREMVGKTIRANGDKEGFELYLQDWEEVT